MVTISKATVADNIFETFYDLISDNVTDPNPPEDGSSRKWIFSSYPDVPIKGSADEVSKVKDIYYPVITVESPDIEWEVLSIGRNWVNARLLVTVYSTNKSQTVQLMDSVVEAIETRRRTDLLPIKLVKLNLTAQSSDVLFRDEMKVHSRDSELTVSFSYKRTL